MCSAPHTAAASPGQVGVHGQNSPNPGSASMGGQGPISAPAPAPAPSTVSGGLWSVITLKWAQQSSVSSAAADCLPNKKAFQESPPEEPHNPSPLTLWNFHHHTSLSCFAQTQPKKAAGGWDSYRAERGQRWGLAQGGIRICSNSSFRGQRAPTLWHGDRARAPGGTGMGVLTCIQGKGWRPCQLQLCQHQPSRHQCQEHVEPQRILKELTAGTSAAFPVRNIPQPSNDARPLFRAFVTGPC